MNKLKISKVLDTLALVSIVLIFALYIFRKPSFDILSVCLISIAILKVGASMLKATYFSNLCREVEKERDIFKEKITYLENEINKLSNKE
ncbi:MAG: hypothetical protein ACTTJH_04900 [Bacteroidales bacterium]